MEIRDKSNDSPSYYPYDTTQYSEIHEIKESREERRQFGESVLVDFVDDARTIG